MSARDRWIGFGAAAFVVVVTAVLALPSLMPPFICCSSSAKALSDLRVIRDALAAYAAEHAGRFPETLAALVTPDANERHYLELARVPRDPWKSEYVYVAPLSAGAHPRVYSLGMDFTAGTDDDIELDE